MDAVDSRAVLLRYFEMVSADMAVGVKEILNSVEEIKIAFEDVNTAIFSLAQISRGDGGVNISFADRVKLRDVGKLLNALEKFKVVTAREIKRLIERATSELDELTNRVGEADLRDPLLYKVHTELTSSLEKLKDLDRSFNLL